MDQLQISARFPHIDPAHLVEFKGVAAELVALARAEPGTLHYALFLNADETVGVIREVYVDSNAVLAHLAGSGAVLGRLIALGGGVQIECFGAPSPALIAASAALAPTVYTFVDSKYGPCCMAVPWFPRAELRGRARVRAKLAA